MGAAYSSIRLDQSFVCNFLSTPKFCFLFLLLYVPCQQLWSLWDGQFTLPHFFPGQA